MNAAGDEVLALVDTFGEALYNQDTEAGLEVLDDHTDLTIIPSEGVEVHRGVPAVRAFLERIHAGPRRYGWRWEDRWVSVVGDAAWFTAVGEEVIDEAPAGARHISYCLTGAAVFHAGRWRLRLLHASEDATRSR